MSDYDVSDETDEEGAERDKKIFCTLQDAAAVLPKLRFYKDQKLNEGSSQPENKSFRLPRPNPDGEPETYESLHRLLEELELLLKGIIIEFLHCMHTTVKKAGRRDAIVRENY